MYDRKQKPDRVREVSNICTFHLLQDSAYLSSIKIENLSIHQSEQKPDRVRKNNNICTFDVLQYFFFYFSSIQIGKLINVADLLVMTP